MAHEPGTVSKEEEPEVTPSVEEKQPDMTPPHSAPDGGWGWICVLGASIMFIIFGATIRGFGVIYLTLLERYNQSATATSWVGAINFGMTGFVGEYLVGKRMQVSPLPRTKISMWSRGHFSVQQHTCTCQWRPSSLYKYSNMSDKRKQ